MLQMHDGVRIGFTGLVALGLAIAAAGRPLHAQTESPDRVDFSGDLRLRWEGINAEGSDDRRRARLRARFGMRVTPAERLSISIRLATGSGDPVSRNLTLDSGFSARDIVIDRAHVDWRLTGAVTAKAGRFGLPWFRPGGSQLVWDSDFTPEGLALEFDEGAFFGSAAAVDLDRPAGDDAMLTALQGGIRGELPGDAAFVAGAGYFDYDDAAGGPPFHDGAPRGNRVDVAGNYLADFRLLELFAELRLSRRGVPIVAYADYVRNTAASADDDGYALGLRLGSAGQPGDLRFEAGWQETDPDAVVGLYTWSDLASGEADSRGAFIETTYTLRENIELGATLISSQRGVADGPARGFDRLMLDIEFSFD